MRAPLRTAPAPALALALALTGCAGGSDDVPRAEVERQVQDSLRGQGYDHVKGVVCDGDLPAKEKAALECDVDTGAKTPVRVRLTVTDVSSSGEVRYDIEDAEKR